MLKGLFAPEFSSTTSVDDPIPALMTGGVFAGVARGDQVKVEQGG
jgi:hypothetical protein